MEDVLPTLADGRVLVIDDNVEAADSFGWLLEAYHYKAEVRYSAEAGLELAKKFNPHVVFCDLGMPGMSGYEFARKLKAQEQNQKTMIVCVSGWNDDRAKSRTKNAGFDAHLVKPASFFEIQIILEDYYTTRISLT